MGDFRRWSLEPKVSILEERSSFLSLSPSSLSSDQTAICFEYWQKAEEATQGIIAKVQPTLVSENRRNAVIDYVQNLIRTSLGCEVFPFGSVPLKTYLPDGDIDLTAFGGLNVEESLANEVCRVLDREDQNGGAEFMVKDVHLIRAEVKLVKCLVQNIVVDISFNQLGGLCTLCFLEKVDRLIGKDHLFKRSIILIKAWCYYESRILGAHHGLISTYALETLVLYIFHLFHSSLNGPLVVLYKFLDYFSKFDWDNYCISLNGPVRLSSLPELLVETPDNSGDDLLLTNEFLKECVDTFSVPSRGYETQSRAFPPKYLNIVDPLKENNNLGRSVSKGNFYRIRSAFTYGARKLGRILSQPEEDIGDEVRKFFSNTLDRHGSGQRPDVQDHFPAFGHDGFSAASRVTGTNLQEDQTTYETEPSFSSSMTVESRLDHEGSLYSEISNSEASCMKIITARGASEPCKIPMEIASSAVLKSDSSNGAAVSENRLKGDAKDLATSRIQSLTISNGPLRSPPSIDESTSPLSYVRHAPHLYFSHSSMGNGEMKDGSQDMKQRENSWSTDNKVVGQDDKQIDSDHEAASPVMQKNHLSSLSSIARSAEDLYPHYSVYQLPRGNAESPEPSNSLSDLSGDYENHCSNLQYGRFCYECVWTTPVPAVPPLMLSMQLRQNDFSQMNANGIVPGSGLYPIQIYHRGMLSGMEEMPKQRGTGTFLPKVHYRDRPMTPRGRHQASARSPCKNGRMVKPPPSENGFPDRSSHEAAQSSQIYVYKGSGKFGSAESTCGSPGRKASPHANGSILLGEHSTEFGPISNLPSETPLFRGGIQAVETQNLTLNIDSPGTEGTKALVGIDKDRIAAQSYHLKDDEDFPPLSF